MIDGLVMEKALVVAFVLACSTSLPYSLFVQSQSLREAIQSRSSSSAQVLHISSLDPIFRIEDAVLCAKGRLFIIG
jgi:hypothetical protein